MGIFIGGVLASLMIMGRNLWKSWVVDVPRVVEIVKVGVVGGLMTFFVVWYLDVLLWAGF